ncbi:hypothetical protein Patl1_07078 [Pistacia atlantica]|uniref:Uncharacterized protein n=1 Tax=Pistacia atlantica TaxID=434234 RepID=A0ACC1AJF1_9ROSI|nr:hypothetical protein Patl1_07078 [Pistacia atlantica]
MQYAPLVSAFKKAPLTRFFQEDSPHVNLTRFFTLHRIKPHAAPLVHAPINSFEFHSCKCIIQAGSLMRSYSITRVDTHNA